MRMVVVVTVAGTSDSPSLGRGSSKGLFRAKRKITFKFGLFETVVVTPFQKKKQKIRMFKSDGLPIAVETLVGTDSQAKASQNHVSLLIKQSLLHTVRLLSRFPNLRVIGVFDHDRRFCGLASFFEAALKMTLHKNVETARRLEQAAGLGLIYRKFH